jgi:hypothetical protein
VGSEWSGGVGMVRWRRNGLWDEMWEMSSIAGVQPAGSRRAFDTTKWEVVLRNSLDYFPLKGKINFDERLYSVAEREARRSALVV